MAEAAFWGFVGGVALLIGAAVGLWVPASSRAVGLVMAFGSGVLISALAFDLTEEAFAQGGLGPVAGGMAAGALAFFVGDLIVDRRGGNHRKRSDGQQDSGSATAIVLGSLMDGVPESVAIGVSLLGGGAVAAPVVVAVFLSNVPESLSAAKGLRAAGHSTRYVLGLWTAVALASTVAAAVGFGALGGASGEVVAGIQAFAAGAILTMLADTMMPEAFEHGGPAAGLVTVLGFTLAFWLPRSNDRGQVPTPLGLLVLELGQPGAQEVGSGADPDEASAGPNWQVLDPFTKDDVEGVERHRGRCHHHRTGRGNGQHRCGVDEALAQQVAPETMPTQAPSSSTSG